MSTQVEAMPDRGPVPGGFNWGAFVFPIIFLLCNRRVGTAVGLIALSVVISSLGDGGEIFSAILSFGVSLYFGATAKEIAWATGRYASYEELARSTRRWNIAALIVVAALVLVVVIALIQ